VTYVIEKDFAFSASHEIVSLPSTHPCNRLHGHNYVVRVRLTGDTLDRHGFLLDYGQLAPFGAWLDRILDHRHLNSALDSKWVTAERLAQRLASVVEREVDIPEGVSVSVGVSETPKTWAWWTP
jgi:6-pyruvoyltetrahydropterin/6-carboxytetrahydropterin synthase